MTLAVFILSGKASGIRQIPQTINYLEATIAYLRNSRENGYNLWVQRFLSNKH